MTSICNASSSDFYENGLPVSEYLKNRLEGATKVLESESNLYRPYDKDGNPGGLLDFTSKKFESLPVIVVPDLHGRYDFLCNLMGCHIVCKEKTVLENLFDKEVRIVCVGDGMHSESRGRERWLEACNEYENGNIVNPAMIEEMKENLLTMMYVMALKEYFPENFHFLKGNHENILNQEGHGNHPFKKYAHESFMVYDFMDEVYGEAILNLMGDFESKLPLLAVFPECVISHAEPLVSYSRNEIVNCYLNASVILGLTWTANDSARLGSVEQTIKNLFHNGLNSYFSSSVKKMISNAVYIGGHRTVKERFALRQNGRYVQIHNPNEENVAFVQPGKIFNPNTDILALSDYLYD